MPSQDRSRAFFSAISSAARQRAPLLIRKCLVLAYSYPQAALRRPSLAFKYLLTDRETSNFLYPIGNTPELIAFIARAFDADESQISDYVRELEDDADFRQTLTDRVKTRRDRNGFIHYGRRAGWYAITRLLKPRLVIESGVHDGLGSSVLLHALSKNAPNDKGSLVGIDIDSASGWLIPPYLLPLFQLVVGDSLIALPSLLKDRVADMFIHDSLHDYEHQMAEYTILGSSNSRRALVLSDSAHDSSALIDFSQLHRRTYSFWREKSVGHFYPGDGIGLSQA